MLADDKINLFTDSQTGWLAATGWNRYLYNLNKNKDGYIGYLPQPYSWYDGHEKEGSISMILMLLLISVIVFI